MRYRTLLPLSLLAISGAALGGGSASPAKIERLAAEAPTDERSMEKLVRLLGAKDAETRARAEAALVAIGDPAIMQLRIAIQLREDFAGAALMTLGKMGDPDAFDIIRSARNDAQLAEAAENAWIEAEKAFWEKVKVTTNTRDCDLYEASWPTGPHITEVQRIHRELSALNALNRLGINPDAAALTNIVEQYPGTEAERLARRGIAEQYVLAAKNAIDGARPVDALEALAQAKRVDPSFDIKEFEAVAYRMKGAQLYEAGKLDEAILDLESAVELGDAQARDFYGLYLMERAETSANLGNLRRAMSDLARVVELGGPRAEEAARRSEKLVATMLGEISSGTPKREEAAAALALAGSSVRGSLRNVVLARVASGDGLPLRGVASALGSAAPDSEDGRWMGSLLADAAAAARGPAEAVVVDNARVAALLRPAEMWSDAARREREAALNALFAYEITVSLSRAHEARGGALNASLPPDALRSEDELARMLIEGKRPDNLDMRLLERAQLLRHILWTLRELEVIAATDPARVALQFLGRPRLPANAAEWAILADDARVRSAKARYPAPLADGGNGELGHEFMGDRLLIVLRVPPRTPMSEGMQSDAITVLMGMARLMMAAVPTLDRLELVIRDRNDDLGAPAMFLGIARKDVRSMDWAAVEAAAPFGARHMALVPYREPR